MSFLALYLKIYHWKQTFSDGNGTTISRPSMFAANLHSAMQLTNRIYGLYGCVLVLFNNVQTAIRIPWSDQSHCNHSAREGRTLCLIVTPIQDEGFEEDFFFLLPGARYFMIHWSKRNTRKAPPSQVPLEQFSYYQSCSLKKLTEPPDA